MNITNNHTHTITAMHDTRSSMNLLAQQALTPATAVAFIGLDHQGIVIHALKCRTGLLLDWNRITELIKHLANMQETQQYGSACRCCGIRASIALAHQHNHESDLEPQPLQRTKHRFPEVAPESRHQNIVIQVSKLQLDHLQNQTTAGANDMAFTTTRFKYACQTST